jgi:predicted secreted protein
MAQIKGRDGSITIDAGAVGELRTINIDMQQATVQTKFPTMNTPAPALEFVAGESSWTATADVFFDSADAGVGFGVLGDGSGNWGPETAVAFVAVVEDNTTDGQVSGSAIITGANISANLDGDFEGSITLQGTGELALQTAAAS